MSVLVVGGGQSHFHVNPSFELSWGCDKNIKCENCSFIAKNEQVLKVHFTAKHTQPQKFKCFVCDFSSLTKEELTEHNDVYWDSHRMTFYPKKKKYYLEEIAQMEKDGFTVKESFLNEVLKSND